MSNRKTVRRDWLKRQIQKGLIEIKCTGIYTDDYYGDSQNEYSKTDWYHADIKDFSDHDFTYTSGYAYQENDEIIHWTVLANHFYVCRVISEEQAEAYRQAKLSKTSVDSQGDLTGFEGVETDEIKELIAETIAEHTDEEWRTTPAEQQALIAETIAEATPEVEAVDERIAQETCTQAREERLKQLIKDSVKLLGLDPEWFYNIQVMTQQTCLMGTYQARIAETIIKAGFPLKVEDSGWLAYESYHLRIILT